MKRLMKLICLSFQFVAIVAVLSLVYAFFTRGAVTPAYVFSANFLAGAFIILTGLVVMLTPTFLLMKKSGLLDHSTYGRRFMEEREKKRIRAYEFMYIGMLNIVITAIIQLILSFIF